MTQKRWKCTNPSCKRKGILELMQLNPGSANYRPYCIKNKRDGTLDYKKLELLKINGAKWRCNKCFATFLKKQSLTAFYHLIEVAQETNETNGTNETKESVEKPTEEVNNVRTNKDTVYADTLQQPNYGRV